MGKENLHRHLQVFPLGINRLRRAAEVNVQINMHIFS